MRVWTRGLAGMASFQLEPLEAGTRNASGPPERSRSSSPSWRIVRGIQLQLHIYSSQVGTVFSMPPRLLPSSMLRVGVLELRPGFGAKLSGDLFASGYHRRRDLSQLSASTMAANILAENSQRWSSYPLESTDSYGITGMWSGHTSPVTFGPQINIFQALRLLNGSAWEPLSADSGSSRLLNSLCEVPVSLAHINKEFILTFESLF